jgi:hypothetical protein
MKLPADLTLDALVARPLAETIRAVTAPGVRGWYGFEDLWRKTRVAVRFDGATGRFVMPPAPTP